MMDHNQFECSVQFVSGGGLRKERKKSRSRSPRLLRRKNKSLKGGWKSVPKSNPELWQKVLNSVKREPGPWAAWKAMKADKIYKEKGGKFLRSREKKSRSSRRKL